METTESIVRNVLSMEICVDDAEEVRSTARLHEELGLDSLDKMELVQILEEKFNIAIDDEDIDGLDTIQQVVAYVEKKRAR